MNEPILVQRDGPIATVVFNRPAQRNAISYEMWGQLGQLAPELDADPVVRVVIFRGAGEDAFSAGADISEFAAQKHNAILCYRSQLYDPSSKELETNLSTEAFLRRVEARQRFYGSLIAVEQAEGFIVREALNVHDPVELLTRKMNMYS